MRRGIWVSCCALLTVCSSMSFAAPPMQVESGLFKPQAPAEIDYQTYIDVNQLLMFVTNIGSFAYDNAAIFGKRDGLYYPKGTNLTVIFAAGLWLGGKVEGDLRVSLGEYSHTYVPGPMADGTFQEDRDEFKVYKIVKELRNSGFYEGPRPSGDPALEELWDDYHNWPGNMGAPVDAEGKPKITGDQTIWCVYNDASPDAHVNSAGSSEGLGIEVQQTVFACDRADALGNCIFMRYVLINKGGNNLDDMYVGLWADPDIGDASDDYAGCDPAVSLGYGYNAHINDVVYGTNPPAVGFDLLSGPIVPSPGDSAFFLGDWRPGYRNLPMTSFAKYLNGTDPRTAQETYWYMQGLDAKNSGSAIINPITGLVTTYMLSGDPVTGTGWLDSGYRVVCDGYIDVFEVAGPGGVPIDPPDTVFESWNSTHEWLVFSDQRYNVCRMNWCGHLGNDTWEFRFTAAGSEYYDWITEEKFGNRAPFEVWNLGAGTPEDPIDKRIQFAIIDYDESHGWSPGDRIYPFEREYYEPLPQFMEYTWDDDFRIGRIIFNAAVPQEGTVVQFIADDTADCDTIPGRDCKYTLSSGPFDMAPNDTQEVWMAVIVGQGGDRLASITELKLADSQAQMIFEACQTCDYSTVCEASVTQSPAALEASTLQKKAPFPPDPEVVPNSFNIHLTFCERIDISVGDSARVFVDADESGTFDCDEQYPAAVSRTGGDLARDVTINVVVNDELQLNDARVAIYSVAGICVLDEAYRRIDYLRLNASFTHTGNQQSLVAGEQVPEGYSLGPSYPNPFNASTKISYSLGESGPVMLTVYDILGRRVRTLVDEVKSAGEYEARWDGVDNRGNPVASGVYFYQLTVGDFVETRKLSLVK